MFKEAPKIERTCFVDAGKEAHYSSSNLQRDHFPSKIPHHLPAKAFLVLKV